MWVSAGIDRGVLNWAPMGADCNFHPQDALSPSKGALDRVKWGSRVPLDKRHLILMPVTQPRSLGYPDCRLVMILTELSRLLNKRISTPRFLLDFVTLVIPIKLTEDIAITGEDWFEGRGLNFLK